MSGETLLTWVAGAQGLYYLVTGVWPFVSMWAFEAVTGPKLEHWLVRTVGVLVGVTGAVCLLAVDSGRFTPEVALLALGNAIGLTAIDVYYVAVRRIAPIYLADAAAEIVLITGWIAGWSLGGLTN